MLVASAFLAAMGVFVKLGSAHFSSAELVFYRALFGLVAVYGLARARGLPAYSPRWRLHLGRSCVGFVAMMLLFYVIGELPLSTATTLNFTSPLFLVPLAWLLFREKPKLRLAAAVALGFSGVALLLRPTFDAHQIVAGLLGLASGLCAAVAFLMTRQLGLAGEPAWRVVLYLSLVSAVCAGVLALVGGLHPVSGEGLLILLGLGVCATLGQLAMTRAYHEGDTLTVGSLSYSTVLFTALLGIALWGEQLPISSWLAMVLIAASGIAAMKFAQHGPKPAAAA